MLYYTVESIAPRESLSKLSLSFALLTYISYRWHWYERAAHNDIPSARLANDN